MGRVVAAAPESPAVEAAAEPDSEAEDWVLEEVLAAEVLAAEEVLSASEVEEAAEPLAAEVLEPETTTTLPELELSSPAVAVSSALAASAVREPRSPRPIAVAWASMLLRRAGSAVEVNCARVDWRMSMSL